MDTIAALSTPAGRSGIGVIRVSGADAFKLCGALFTEEEFSPKERGVFVRTIFDPQTKQEIDEAVFTFFVNPNSFTGENVCEISCHGSPVILRLVLDSLLFLGARLADAGEFTLRALSNGKLDLAQAEAIRDLIDANSVAMSRQAIMQLNGEFSHQLQPLKSDILDVIVVLESALEFVEDDLPETQKGEIRSKLFSISSRLAQFAETYKAGKLLREGIRVALVGRPNVGKSSLFNKLIGTEQAIVTNIPGTTRDQLREQIAIRGLSISLIDTAGLRETTDEVESIGVDRSRRAMVDADLILVILDGSETLSSEDIQILLSVRELNYLIVSNKNDLSNSKQLEFDLPDSVDTGGFISNVISVSAKTGDGLEELQAAIVEPFTSSEIEQGNFLVSDSRHRDLLVRSYEEVQESIYCLDAGESEEIILIGLHNAIRYLGEITGETTTEDMLTRIFSTFCIGK
ncbi:MAG: tRNA uridine-5-carboxymethylaminomethyl(34) synthesis GTPase MnmE [Pyrinomonadaceae bacterium]